MAPTALRPGGEIDAWCTKCRMDLLHRIIAMRGDKVVRVECRTCGGHHNYRRQKGGAAEAPAPKPGRAASQQRTAMAEAERQRIAEWRKAVEGRPAAAFKPYRATQVYARGDLIRHGKFGDGYVIRIFDRQKVEAMFQDGPRTLAQALEG